MTEYKIRIDVEPLEENKDVRATPGFSMYENFYRFTKDDSESGLNKHIYWHLEQVATGLICQRKDTSIGHGAFEVIVRDLE